MKKNILTYGAFLLLALSGCGGGDSPSPTPPPTPEPEPEELEVAFTSTFSGASTFTGFQSNDNISVTAFEGGDVFESDVVYTFTGNTFKSVDPIEYEDDDQSLSFIAVYPYTEDIDGAFTFKVKADQSSQRDFKESHLLTAQISSTKQLTPQFSFVARTAAVSINVVGRTGGSLNFYAMPNVDCNIANGTFVASGDVTTFTPLQNGDTYSIMVAPQDIAAGTVIAEYIVDGEVHQWTTTTSLPLTAGEAMEFEWSIDDNRIMFNGQIIGWSVVQGGSI